MCRCYSVDTSRLRNFVQANPRYTRMEALSFAARNRRSNRAVARGTVFLEPNSH